ncbi:heat shock protein beta-1-like [Oppia nitens]|uniref:heat shock protein beta-1-like n=1 Tax=Oppia nitens TaxID=1686743 RepID=UPI0023DB785E|nr:heat shock protein beta-1-like [Oppia nitens]XP_054154233.1 heat shock protein beta-1-like [Oppia nitens]
MAPERKVPVLRSENNIIDKDFGSIRERFESEMRKMEDEMNRFRNQLVDKESSLFGPNYTSSITEKRSSSHTSSQSSDVRGDTNRGGELTTWLDDLNSPLIQDSGDGKVLKLRFDVTQYAPEEIVVKTVDNRLQVHAKHDEKTDNRSVYREYNREFLLPKGTNPELIRSSLSKDGVLTVEAPVPAIEGSRRIPIDKK